MGMDVHNLYNVLTCFNPSTSKSWKGSDPCSLPDTSAEKITVCPCFGTQLAQLREIRGFMPWLNDASWQQLARTFIFRRIYYISLYIHISVSKPQIFLCLPGFDSEPYSSVS